MYNIYGVNSIKFFTLKTEQRYHDISATPVDFIIWSSNVLFMVRLWKPVLCSLKSLKILCIVKIEIIHKIKSIFSVAKISVLL